MEGDGLIDVGYRTGSLLDAEGGRQSAVGLEDESLDTATGARRHGCLEVTLLKKKETKQSEGTLPRSHEFMMTQSRRTHEKKRMCQPDLPTQGRP